MSTLLELRSGVLTRMALASGEMFSVTEVDRAINLEYEHTQTEINMKNDEYFGEEVTFPSAGDGGVTTITPYAFPDDFIKLLSLEIKLTNRWTPIPKISPHMREDYKYNRAWLTHDLAVHYYIIGNNFYFVPDLAPPAGGVDNLRMLYIYQPSALVLDADEPAFPSQYQEILEIGATNRLRKSLKEPPQDVDEYNAKLLQLTETISPRVKHQPKTVRMVRGGLY